MAKAILSTVIGTLVASAAVLPITAQTAQAQGFTGSFAPDQWQLFNTSPAFPDIDNSQITIGGVPLAPFNGLADFTNAPDSVDLLGSDQSAILEQFGLNCDSRSLPVSLLFLCNRGTSTFLYISVPETSIFSFNWDYTTEDSAGPAFDPFGFALGEFSPDAPGGLLTEFTELIDRGGPLGQSGTAMVRVEANQVFAFQIGTADNRGGRAHTTISQFQALVTEPDVDGPTSVPEPSSLVAIAALVLGGLGLSNKGRS